jgi:hypothetical protein
MVKTAKNAVVDHALIDLCAGAVETVKGAGGDVAEELCAIARKCRAKPVEYLDRKTPRQGMMGGARYVVITVGVTDASSPRVAC